MPLWLGGLIGWLVARRNSPREPDHASRGTADRAALSSDAVGMEQPDAFQGVKPRWWRRLRGPAFELSLAGLIMTIASFAILGIHPPPDYPTATVLNDSTQRVTLQNCTSYDTTVDPGGVERFVLSGYGTQTCDVVPGDGTTSVHLGCLVIPVSGNGLHAVDVVPVTSMRKSPQVC